MVRSGVDQPWRLKCRSGIVYSCKTCFWGSCSTRISRIGFNIDQITEKVSWKMKENRSELISLEVTAFSKKEALTGLILLQIWYLSCNSCPTHTCSFEIYLGFGGLRQTFSWWYFLREHCGQWKMEVTWHCWKTITNCCKLHHQQK